MNIYIFILFRMNKNKLNDHRTVPQGGLVYSSLVLQIPFQVVLNDSMLVSKVSPVLP